MKLRRNVVFAVLFASIGLSVFAQSKDPFASTWLLARGKSDFDPPSNFFRRTLILEPIESGHKCIVRTVTDRQQTIEYVYEARFDGKDTPSENTPFETMAIKRRDESRINQKEGLSASSTTSPSRRTWRMSIAPSGVTAAVGAVAGQESEL